MRIRNWFFKVWLLLTYRFKKSGVRILASRISGDGSFIDIRYWLSRPDKLNKKYTPYLVDEATKEYFYPANIVKYGMVRTKHGKHTNYGVVLFHNRDKILKAGSKVVLVIDDLLSEKTEVL